MNAHLVSYVCLLLFFQVDAAPDEPILLQAMNENDFWPNGSAHHGMNGGRRSASLSPHNPLFLPARSRSMNWNSEQFGEKFGEQFGDGFGDEVACT